MIKFSVLLLVSGLSAFAQGSDTNSRSGILQFADGSLLHGTLNSVNGTNELAWTHPAAKDPLRFTLTNISLVRFENAEAPKREFSPTARFQFKNGDELMGNIRSIESGKLQFQSWIGGAVEAPLPALESIQFSARGYNLLYEGPMSTKTCWFRKHFILMPGSVARERSITAAGVSTWFVVIHIWYS